MKVNAEIQERPDSRLGQSGPPSVGICILNWNGWRDTLECVESIRQQDYPHFLTVIVDNRSLKDSAERIRSWAQKNLAEASDLSNTGERLAAAAVWKTANLACGDCRLVSVWF